MNARLLVVSLALGCGAAGTVAATEEPRPEERAVAPDVVAAPDTEVDPQICAHDEDCMVGTLRDCCVSFCTSDQPWSRAAWAAYQAECAEEECASTETEACPPDTAPPAVARCVEERCVLTRPGA